MAPPSEARHPGPTPVLCCREELADRLPQLRVLRSLSAGRGREVLLASAGGRQVVVKALRHFPGRHRIRRGGARREAAMLAAAQGPHVVRLEQVEVGRWFTFLVMEHLPGPPLRARLAAPWSAADLVAAGLGVSLALARLHRADILFNDLKPRNIGVASLPSSPSSPQGGALEVVKLLDFGHARTLADSRMRHSLCGSADYAPPEAWGPGFMAPASDVWSWGRSWHLLASGKPFVRIHSFEQLLRSGRPPLPPVAEVSRAPLPADLARLIDGCMASDPQARPVDGAELHGRLQQIARAEWGENIADVSCFASPAPDGGLG